MRLPPVTKIKKNAARKIEETAARMENDRNGPHQARFDGMSPYAPGEAKSGEPDFESGH